MKMNVLFITIISLFLSQSAFSKEIGKVLFVKGKATFAQKGQKQNIVKKGLTFDNKTFFITGKKSLVILSLNDGSKIKVSPNSKLYVNMPAKKATSTSLLKGNAFFYVLKSKLRKKDKFVVKTKFAAMGVRGTEFFVSYGQGNNPKDVWMCVKEGLVAVKRKADKKATLVKTGEGVQISKSDGVTAPTPLPWTEKLNWNMAPDKGDLENKVNIEDAYTDLLDKDYD